MDFHNHKFYNKIRWKDIKGEPWVKKYAVSDNVQIEALALDAFTASYSGDATVAKQVTFYRHGVVRVDYSFLHYQEFSYTVLKRNSTTIATYSSSADGDYPPNTWHTVSSNVTVQPGDYILVISQSFENGDRISVKDFKVYYDYEEKLNTEVLTD